MTREKMKKAFVDEAEKTTIGRVKLTSMFILARILEIIDEVFDKEESENELREIAERQKQREIDEMVKQGGDRELIEYIYDRLIERVCSEIDRKLIGGAEDDTV